jgi:predicted ATP-binding protein involved in virulence
MEVKSFQLSHIGRFEYLDVPLAPTADRPSNVTVFVGNNGAGKTTILNSLAYSLSWLVARIRNEKGRGEGIPEELILNGKPDALIRIEVTDRLYKEDESFAWELAKVRPGRKSHATSKFEPLTSLADLYRSSLTDDESNASLPIIAYYSVERAVLDVPVRIRTRHNFDQMEGYDNALSLKGVDFRRFFEWFRDREDVENESGISADTVDLLLGLFDESDKQWESIQNELKQREDPQLAAVRSAIYSFMPGFRHLRVRRKPRLHMSVTKDDMDLNVLQLSQGEKSLMALVGDIARRLAMMNPGLENPLEGDGIVLIDEVDMHLHPSWQREIIERLTTTFPNCQFVLTTHSPLVISETKDVLVYSLDDGELTQEKSQYGQDANSVLLEVMDTHPRNLEVTQKLGDLLDVIQDGELEQARNMLGALEQELPEGADNLELIKARFLLRKQELRREKNNQR